MKFMPEHFFHNIGFRQQLILTFTVGVIFLSSVTSIATISVSHRTVYQQLEEQGKHVTENFAKQSTLALLYQSPENAVSAIDGTLAFSDVLALGIYTTNHDALIEQGALNFPQLKSLSFDALSTSNDEDAAVWFFTAPVYTKIGDATVEPSPFSDLNLERELIGYVRVILSKNTLYAMEREIVVRSVAITFALASILLLLLLAITTKVTQPLKELATTMRRAEDGDKGVRARLCGSKDVRDMETAFNTMMSELEKREQELERTRDTALSLAQIKGEFASNVTHELRTPMNGVMGMLQLLQTTAMNEKQQDFVRIAKESGDSMLLLIDDILDFSKLESGKLTIHPVTFDPQKIVSDISELLSPQANKGQLWLKYSCADNVPPMLKADAARIRQVLINLIGNAIKFTHTGGVDIHLSYTVADDGDGVMEFSVRDSGIGIAEKSLRTIFEAFAQVDGSITRNYGGTGLGLAICKQLVELMRGTITVNSTPDQGSTFSFSIPVETAIENEQLDDSGSLIAGLNVLLATTIEKREHWLKQTFGEWGCTTRNVASTEEVLISMRLAAAEGHSIDLIVIDTMLPDLNADELLQHYGTHPAIPKPMIIILTEENAALNDSLPEYSRYFIHPLEKYRFYHAVLAIFESGERQSSKQTDTAQITQPWVNSQSSKRILIAEDNRTNQYVVLGMLESLDYSADVVSDGNAALSAMKDGNYGAILMDCVMPGLDGYEATRKIRQFDGPEKYIPIIALTANTGTDDSNRCLTAGMSDYIAKPVAMDVLKEKLHKWLGAGDPHEQPAAHKEERPALQHEQEKQPQQLLKNQTLEPVNWKTLHWLRAKIGSRYQATISVFIEDAQLDIYNIESAIADHNCITVKNIAHRLKGGSLNLGAEPLAATCKHIENTAEDKEWGQLQSLASQAKVEFSALAIVLNNEIAGTEAATYIINDTESTILIADDDRSARLALMGALESEGYQLLQADNGNQALNICRYARPDIVLLDVMMPIMDGLTACKEILMLQPDYNPPILMITALHDDTAIDKAFAAGATDFVTKPVNLSVIRQRIARLLKTDKAEKHVHQLAYYDALTHLPNRALFVQRATDMIADAKNRGYCLSLLILALDRFKYVNDSLGHEAGDQLLVMVAERLERSVRKDDVIARFGGDEFAIALEGVEEPDLAAKVAQKICRALALPYVIDGKKIFIGSSIGIALSPDHGETAQHLLKKADTAMFRAKARGGSCFQFFEDGMAQQLIERMELENELRIAIDNNQLEIFYQPQIDLDSNKITGVEALLRWHHPTRGFVSPAEFIPLAEESGLIISIGDWVLENACQQLRLWLDQGLEPFTLAINISKHQMRSGDLQERVQQVITELKLQPELIKLEITESGIEEDPEGMMDLLNRVHATGVTLAIDDFGTGYSSLSYLKRFPLDTLKIDMSFIKDITEDPDSSAIVAGIIALGQSLRMKIIAEGVETEAQQDLLRQLKCDQIQGFLLAKPMPAKELYEWMLQSHVTQRPQAINNGTLSLLYKKLPGDNAR